MISSRSAMMLGYEHDLGDLVRDLACMLEVSLSKKAELCVDVAAGIPGIEADPSQIQQVVLNLITNAAESIGDAPGLVRITVGSVRYDEARLEAELWDTRLAPGAYVVLKVEDTGAGMDAETRERMFEPFFTTKELGKGSGQGLAISHAVVDKHGGRIDVDTVPGQGTRITVRLPL